MIAKCSLINSAFNFFDRIFVEMMNICNFYPIFSSRFIGSPIKP